MTIAGEQADAITVSVNNQAEAVMLDFVKPLWPARNLGSVGRQAELKRFKHAPKIGETCLISLLGIFCDRTLTWVPALDGKCVRVSEFSHEEMRR
jgi:hypothetical protein